MALTPVEIRHMKPGRGLFGYKTGPTDRLLADIEESFEDVWRERADLADRVEQLEADLVRYRELESLLRTTLVSAERASADMKEQARREAELILGEAHAEAREIQRNALAENERLATESRRLRVQLEAALASVEAPDPEAALPRPEPEPAGDGAEGGEPVQVDGPGDTWHGFAAGLPLPDADAA